MYMWCDHARTRECRDAGSKEQLLKEIRELYTSKVVAGHDIEIYRRACAQFLMTRLSG